jgi:hypothetical protein
MADKRLTEAAKTLARLGAAEGGRARAANLTPEERSESARQAAAARWGTRNQLPEAIYGSSDRPLRIGDVEIPCYVLNDGRRVLVQRGLQAGIGMSTSGGSIGAHRMARFVASLGAKGIEVADLALRIDNPIPFKTPIFARAYGYEATVLPDICRAVLEARRQGVLMKQQEHIARQCEVLLGGLATVGIIAMVDEATGYQDVRARDALARILEKFIAKELRPYVKTFPPDFYKEIYRLRGWTYPPNHNRHNSILGKLTNDLVYDRLAPGVRDELHRLTPRHASGRLKHKLFQRLTPDFGHPKLREHLGGVVMAMKLSGEWSQFIGAVNRLLPKYLPTEDSRGQRSLGLAPAVESSGSSLTTEEENQED